jgi:hypothetical protein
VLASSARVRVVVMGSGHGTAVRVGVGVSGLGGVSVGGLDTTGMAVGVSGRISGVDEGGMVGEGGTEGVEVEEGKGVTV